MINEKDLQKYDKHEMHKVYDNWTQIAKDAYRNNSDHVDFSDINNVIFVGMGGSGTAADIFQSILSQTSMHITVVKGYTLPKTINKETLIVGTSISGNTEETLIAVKDSLNYDCKRITFSSGGKLEEFAKKNDIEHVQLPMYENPRSSLPSTLYIELKALHSTLSIDEKVIIDSLNALSNMREKISSNNLTDQNPAINLASWISKVPFIYYPAGLKAITTRFKNSIHENMKKHAYIENVIESCHNQIMAWEEKTDVMPILLRGTDDHHKTIERWNMVKEILQIHNVEYREEIVSGNNILSKTISTIYKLDYCTIYGAIMSGMDPYPIESINHIKKLLK
ncbi:MAG: SIS domain-containing protein [Candidatus Nitrosoabyssus spongiisocia]|nr:MAG: SIS domain-containing protein [Nitrosopumilaceae archaeon AB1(1)]